MFEKIGVEGSFQMNIPKICPLPMSGKESNLVDDVDILSRTVFRWNKQPRFRIGGGGVHVMPRSRPAGAVR
jgi:hypothetical protein